MIGNIIFFTVAIGIVLACLYTNNIFLGIIGAVVFWAIAAAFLENRRNDKQEKQK